MPLHHWATDSGIMTLSVLSGSLYCSSKMMLYMQQRQNQHVEFLVKPVFSLPVQLNASKICANARCSVYISTGKMQRLNFPMDFIKRVKLYQAA